MDYLSDLAAARRVLRDIATCSEYPQVSQSLGLIPASADVEEREHKDSHVRKEIVFPLFEEIVTHAAFLGDVIYAVSGGDDQPIVSRELFRGVAQRAALGILCHLVDRGLVEIV